MTMIWWGATGCRTTAMVGMVLALSLGGCSKPKPPEKQRPPEPQAQATQLRDAIKAPIDRARDVQADMQKSADDQRAAIAAQVD